jgi:hypothetical protein
MVSGRHPVLISGRMFPEKPDVSYKKSRYGIPFPSCFFIAVYDDKKSGYDRKSSLKDWFILARAVKMGEII